MEKRTEEYDVVVIGGGAGGMTAALYAGRARLKTLLMEKSLIGGLATYTSEIENYPGFPEGIDGTELMKLFDRQFRKFDVKVKLTDCKGISKLNDGRWCVSTFRTDYHAKAVVISTGGRPRLTGAPGEDKFQDKGISFCATCDAARYTGKKVLIIGSGDAAIEEGLFLTRFCSEVWVSVIHDEGHVDANEVAREKAFRNEKMHFIWNTSVDSFEGGELLERVNLKNLKTGEIIPVDVDGCFLFIGYLPNTNLFEGLVNLNERGYIITNEDMETNQPGIFAAGDVRAKTLRQVSTAVGDGAVAGYMAERYIGDLETIHDDIFRKEKILVFFYNASEDNDRATLLKLESWTREKGIDFKAVDIYKSDKIMKILGGKSSLSVMLFKSGKAVASASVRESFDLIEIEMNLQNQTTKNIHKDQGAL